jgi:HK97 gp10 family phage protein
MKAKWEVQGIEEYIAALRDAGKAVNTVSREALADAGKDLKAEMLSRCPTDKLRPYINIFTPSREGDYNYVAVGFIHDLAYTPADIAVAANSVEFGSVHNAPMPFIRPAVSKLKSKVNASIAAKLKAAGLVDT